MGIPILVFTCKPLIFPGRSLITCNVSVLALPLVQRPPRKFSSFFCKKSLPFEPLDGIPPWYGLLPCNTHKSTASENAYGAAMYLYLLIPHVTIRRTRSQRRDFKEKHSCIVAHGIFSDESSMTHPQRRRCQNLFSMKMLNP